MRIKCNALYFFLKIHAESMHLVQVTSNLINNTLVHNPDIQGMLPEGLSTMLDSMFDNAYEYGRDMTVKMVIILRDIVEA